MEPERCEQCGFDGAAYENAELLAALRALGPQWRLLLEHAGAELHARPAPATWSALEYAAHSRDVTALHVFGVEQALTCTEPVLPAVEPGLVDAASEHYASEDPGAVVDALERETTLLADIAASRPENWTCGLTLGADRVDVRRLLEHALHDSMHHLDDVERGLDVLRAGS